MASAASIGRISQGQASKQVMAALIAGLEREFGHAAGAALAERFLDAEECDFHWQARQGERWLGSYWGAETSEIELDRVVIIGAIGSRWFVAICIVDGEGAAHGLLGRRRFRGEAQARRTFADVH